MKNVHEPRGWIEYPPTEDDPRPLYAPADGSTAGSPSGWWRACDTCGKPFPMNRRHRRYCSNACRQAAYRARAGRRALSRMAQAFEAAAGRLYTAVIDDRRRKE